MNDEELAWLTNRHEGEFMYFQSKDGAKDTVIICQIDISNSLNPFNMTYFNTSNTEYIAGGCIHYRFNPNRSLEKASCHFLMTAIRKAALYMLDS